MNGVINILKPPGMTSHDVVNFIRKLSGIKKVGHTGTLDPGAAGVLPVCTGKATKIIEYMNHDKKYRAEFILGRATSTQDSFGQLTVQKDSSDITFADLCKTLDNFSGQIEQVPPMASAVKQKGKKLYELYRQGKEVERKTKEVYIYDIKIVDTYRIGSPAPGVIIDVSCSAGTYIRTIGADLGRSLGSCAYMNFLLRTRAGVFTVNNSYTLEELENMKKENSLQEAFVSISNSLENLSPVVVGDDSINAVRNGNRVLINADICLEKGSLVRMEYRGETSAVGRIMKKEPDSKDEYIIQPVKVLV